MNESMCSIWLCLTEGLILSQEHEDDDGYKFDKTKFLEMVVEKVGERNLLEIMSYQRKC